MAACRALQAAVARPDANSVPSAQTADPVIASGHACPVQLASSSTRPRPLFTPATPAAAVSVVCVDARTLSFSDAQKPSDRLRSLQPSDACRSPAAQQALSTVDEAGAEETTATPPPIQVRPTTPPASSSTRPRPLFTPATPAEAVSVVCVDARTLSFSDAQKPSDRLRSLQPSDACRSPAAQQALYTAVVAGDGGA